MYKEERLAYIDDKGLRIDCNALHIYLYSGESGLKAGGRLELGNGKSSLTYVRIRDRISPSD